GDYSCTFTYSAQGGTNEQWQMNVGTSEDNGLFSCTIWRPQGKSYLFFTQFKAEVKGAKIEYAMAYVRRAVPHSLERPSRAVLCLLFPLLSPGCSLSLSAVSHREGKFRFELSKLVIVAKNPRDEL
ncbi:MYDGF factor, partial [Leiothrix lutea]|nr:MYDGF factor [Leiothrix lutea]